MSNQDRVAQVIQEVYALGGASQDAAKALADAGLLAPERKIPFPLPPKDVHPPAWPLLLGRDSRSLIWVSAMGNHIWIIPGAGGSHVMTTGQAHDFAAVLLSAINYGEKA